MGIHYFLAIRIPEHQANDIHQQIQQHSGLHFKRWVHPLDYHITLAFLGEPVSDRQLAQLSGDVAEALKEDPVFQLEIGGLQTFGPANSPRILWVGTKPSRYLDEVRKKVYTLAGKSGFALDPKPFHPHITVARKWDSKTEFDLPDQTLPFQPFRAAAAELLKTNPDQTPKYETIQTYPLRSEETL
ncbi:RNA 2',3'-cyclic phosphodiesterase [Metabacillus mangrovi]|nr:RNA 2',3'-cyclic phosphodiesterase [Metabacillus mangrovi]